MRTPNRPVSFRERLYVFEVLKGMAVTLRHLVQIVAQRKKYLPTISYPEQRRQYSNRFRGTHILTRHKNGHLKCVACYMCSTVCPADCIRIVAQEDADPSVEKAPKSFQIDLLRCVMCGFCVDACPKEAIIMSNQYEMSVTRREDAVYGIDMLTARPGMENWGLGYRPRYAEGAFADGKSGQSALHPAGK